MPLENRQGIGEMVCLTLIFFNILFAAEKKMRKYIKVA